MKQVFPKDAVVLKHGWKSRLYHWCLVFGFLPAALTGFVLWLKPGGEAFVNLAMRIHIAGAALFTVATILYAVFCYDRVIAFLWRILDWTADDFNWMKVSGGYPHEIFLRKKIAVPPMGKMNSGQKIFGICLFFGGLLLLATGWLLYLYLPMLPRGLGHMIGMAHWAVGIFLGAFLFGGHIVLGLYNWGECVCMFGNGTMKVSEAAHHNPLWVENEIEPRESETRPVSGGTSVSS